ncbi:hypothetical protein [Salinarimonas soli]|uniref:hypothetical protein n=1 Tax=Salinarimonas soli TaxID=1638099 RepID=UPI001661E93F|nr:hypothetical protein [Salinarimonas soli]
MSDQTSNPHRKAAHRAKGTPPRPLAADALASAVQAAETTKAAKAMPPAPRPVADAEAKPVPETAPLMPAPARPAPLRPSEPAPRAGLVHAIREHGPLAAAIAMALGLGWVSGLATAIHATPGEVPPAPAALVMDLGVSAPLAIRGSGAETQRLSGDMRTLAGAVADLRAGLDGARQDQAARLARLEAAEAEASARLAGLAERVGAMKDGEPQLAAILERLERMEQAALTRAAAAEPASPQVVAVATPAPTPAPVPAPVTTGSLPEPAAPVAAPEPRPTERAALERAPEKAAEKAPERTEIVAGWFLRGVHRGIALLEGRRGLVEVRAGEVVPGLGRVEAIERRGRDWVVVTARGIVTTETW